MLEAKILTPLSHSKLILNIFFNFLFSWSLLFIDIDTPVLFIVVCPESSDDNIVCSFNFYSCMSDIHRSIEFECFPPFIFCCSSPYVYFLQHV